jgi:hypothetical protein
MSDESITVYHANGKIIHSGGTEPSDRIAFYGKLLIELGQAQPGKEALKTAEDVKKLEAMEQWVLPLMETEGNLETIILGHQRELKIVSNNLRLALEEVDRLKEQMNKAGL